MEMNLYNAIMIPILTFVAGAAVALAWCHSKLRKAVEEVERERALALKLGEMRTQTIKRQDAEIATLRAALDANRVVPRYPPEVILTGGQPIELESRDE